MIVKVTVFYHEGGNLYQASSIGPVTAPSMWLAVRRALKGYAPSIRNNLSAVHADLLDEVPE